VSTLYCIVYAKVNKLLKDSGPILQILNHEGKKPLECIPTLICQFLHDGVQILLRLPGVYFLSGQVEGDYVVNDRSNVQR
jgi:hypothetical protein